MKTVRNLLTITILILSLAYALLPIPRSLNARGSYNAITRLYWCSTPHSCAHERGHALDQALGWPSRSDRFTLAIQTYIVVDVKDLDISKQDYKILDFPGLIRRSPDIFYDGRAELYATLYADAWENIDKIPEAFRKFYLADWDR